MPLRDWTLTRLPPWLLDAYGSAWARAHGDTKDALAALLKERVAARMPVRPGAANLAPHAPTGALEALGRDRLMPRAVGETDAGYAARLADAWTIHADAGTPRGALRALAAAGYPEAMLVIRSQRLYSLDADGELVVTALPPGSWCFEPEPQPFWSRYAVLFAYPNLPPAWTTATTRTLSARVDVNPRGDAMGARQDVQPLGVASTTETAPGTAGASALVAGGSGGILPSAYPAASVTGPVPVGGTYKVVVTATSLPPQFSWYVDDVLQGDGAMDPTEAPVSLVVDATGQPSGVSVAWQEGEPYTVGDAWAFPVTASTFSATYATSTPPTLAQVGALALASRVVVRVAAGSPDYTFAYSVDGAAERTVPMARGTAVHLLLADDSPSGVAVTWPAVETHYPGAEWEWAVVHATSTPPTLAESVRALVGTRQQVTVGTPTTSSSLSNTALRELTDPLPDSPAPGITTSFALRRSDRLYVEILSATTFRWYFQSTAYADSGVQAIPAGGGLYPSTLTYPDGVSSGLSLYFPLSSSYQGGELYDGYIQVAASAPTPPNLSAPGTVAAALTVVVEVQTWSSTGGQFRYSLDGGSTWAGSSVPMTRGTDVALGASGLVVRWHYDTPYYTGDRWSWPVTLEAGMDFTGTVAVDVAVGAPSYTFAYSVDGAAERTVPMARGTAVHLLLADGAQSGVSVTWPAVDTHYQGAAWTWEVADVYSAVPEEDALPMGLVRALTKEWSNAAAVFHGIVIVERGRALGYPLRTLGAADGKKLSGNVVRNYHP